VEVKAKLIGGCILAVLLLAIITNAGQPKMISSHIKEVHVGSAVVRAEVADTPAAQAHGLSGRASLAEGEGMLFIFEEEEPHGIWMKDMNFAIDIVWASSDGTILTIKKHVSPATYPQVFYSSEHLSRYVLEVPAGFSERAGIVVGDKIVVQ